jgi:hypothetical protein
MINISTIDLSTVVGGQKLAHRSSHINAPADYLPPGLRPDQLTTDQYNADSHARVNIGIIIRDVRPWLTPEQSRDPKVVEEFMRPGF